MCLFIVKFHQVRILLFWSRRNSLDSFYFCPCLLLDIEYHSNAKAINFTLASTIWDSYKQELGPRIGNFNRMPIAEQETREKHRWLTAWSLAQIWIKCEEHYWNMKYQKRFVRAWTTSLSNLLKLLRQMTMLITMEIIVTFWQGCWCHASAGCKVNAH